MNTDESTAERFPDWLNRARAGDRRALDRALASVQNRVRLAARRRLGQPLRGVLETSDILQSTYVDVVRTIDTFRGQDEESFAAWLTRILENNIRDKAKFFDRAKRRAPEGDGIHPDSLSDPGPSPSRLAMDVEDLDAVGRAMDRLDEEQRRIITLRMIEGRGYDEIARLLGKREGAARMLYSRARAALAVHIDGLLHDG